MVYSEKFIGIILPGNIYRKLPEVSDNVGAMLSIFEEGAEKNQLKPCYFQLFDIKPNGKYMNAYVKIGDEFVLRKVLIPRIIYSRILDRDPKYKEYIKHLVNKGIIIYNIPNYDVEKLTIHRIIESNETLKKHLPVSYKLTYHSLFRMMELYDNLILKQNYGERGFGAMKLERVENGWCLSYMSKKHKEIKSINFKSKLPRILKEKIEAENYIIQERIPLATFQDNPFDMRIAVQKDRKGKFQVSGVLCKVAKNQHFLTNGSQGGLTYVFDTVGKEVFNSKEYYQARENITRFSIDLAKHLEKYFPHIFEFGFDIGITKDGFPYFIECNFISDFLHALFWKGRLVEERWKRIFTTPFDYARYLIDKYPQKR